MEAKADRFHEKVRSFITQIFYFIEIKSILIIVCIEDNSIRTYMVEMHLRFLVYIYVCADNCLVFVSDSVE